MQPCCSSGRLCDVAVIPAPHLLAHHVPKQVQGYSTPGLSVVVKGAFCVGFSQVLERKDALWCQQTGSWSSYRAGRLLLWISIETWSWGHREAELIYLRRTPAPCVFHLVVNASIMSLVTQHKRENTRLRRWEKGYVLEHMEAFRAISDSKPGLNFTHFIDQFESLSQSQMYNIKPGQGSPLRIFDVIWVLLSPVNEQVRVLHEKIRINWRRKHLLNV